jgi:hypothetical protein
MTSQDQEHMVALNRAAEKLAHCIIDMVSDIRIDGRELYTIEKDFCILLAFRVHQDTIKMVNGEKHFDVVSNAVKAILKGAFEDLPPGEVPYL